MTIDGTLTGMQAVVGDDRRDFSLNEFGSNNYGPCKTIYIDEEARISAIGVVYNPEPNSRFGVVGFTIEEAPLWLMQFELERMSKLERDSETWLNNTRVTSYGQKVSDKTQVEIYEFDLLSMLIGFDGSMNVVSEQGINSI